MSLVNDYLRQYGLAPTPEQKQALSARFSAFYESLSAEDKQRVAQALHPSLLDLKTWTEREIDPLLARADALLARRKSAA